MIIELRIYHCAPGRLPALIERFDRHTLGFFDKHGIKPVEFWLPVIGPSNQTLSYTLEWKDMAERETRWNAFQADPEWIARRNESEAEKIIVNRVENMFYAPAPFFQGRRK